MIRNRTWRFFPLTASVVAAVSCGDATGPAGMLALNRFKWESAAPSTYTYEFGWSCFCPVEMGGPVRISVRGGVVESVVSATTGEPIPTADAERYFNVTVDSLFGVLAQAIRRDADAIRVRYDPSLGYPRDAYIDYEFWTADEELGFSAQLVSPP